MNTNIVLVGSQGYINSSGATNIVAVGARGYFTRDLDPPPAPTVVVAGEDQFDTTPVMTITSGGGTGAGTFRYSTDGGSTWTLTTETGVTLNLYAGCYTILAQERNAEEEWSASGSTEHEVQLQQSDVRLGTKYDEGSLTGTLTTDTPTQGTLTAVDNGDETATLTMSGMDTGVQATIYKREIGHLTWDSSAIATITGDDSATVSLSGGDYWLKALIGTVGGVQVPGATDPVPLHIQDTDKSIQYYDVEEVLGMPGTGQKIVVLSVRTKPVNPMKPGD